MSKMRFIGLDVRLDIMAVAVAEPDGEVRCLGICGGRLFRLREILASGRAYGGRIDGLGFVPAAATRVDPALHRVILMLDSGCRAARHR